MKILSIIFATFLLQGDISIDFKLLTNSWMKRSYEGQNTAILTFKADSTAQLEIRKGVTDVLLRNENGSYQIIKSKDQIILNLNSSKKTYHVEDLSTESISLKNIEDSSEFLTFRKVHQ